MHTYRRCIYTNATCCLEDGVPAIRARYMAFGGAPGHDKGLAAGAKFSYGQLLRAPLDSRGLLFRMWYVVGMY